MPPTIKQRLSAAAFDLFEQQGFDQTTVDQIAVHAGVGRTTFFRTFASKEDAVFPDHAAILAAVEARLAASTQQTALLAITDAARVVLRHYLDEGSVARTRYHLTRNVPALRDREVAGIRQYQRMFARHARTWLLEGSEEPDRDVELDAELVASAVVTAHNQVLRRWLSGTTTGPESEFDAAMARVLSLYGPQAPSANVEAVVVLRSDRSIGEVLPALQAWADRGRME